MKFISILIFIIIISLLYYNRNSFIREGMLAMENEWKSLSKSTPEECQNLAINSNNRFIRTVKNLDEKGECWVSGTNKISAITSNNGTDNYSLWVNKKYNWNNNDVQLKWCGDKKNNCSEQNKCLSLYSENNNWFKISGKNKIKTTTCDSNKSGANKNLLWWKLQKIGDRDGIPENYIKMDYVKSGGETKGKCLIGGNDGLKTCGSAKTKIRIVPWNNIKKDDRVLYKKDNTSGYAMVKEVQLNNCNIVVCPINSATDTTCRGNTLNLKESNIIQIINTNNEPITSSLTDVVQLKNAEGKCLGKTGDSTEWKCCLEPSTRYKPQAIDYKSYNPNIIEYNLGKGKWFNQGNHLVKNGNLNGMFIDNIRFQTLAWDKGTGDTNSKIRIKGYDKDGKEIMHKSFYPGRERKIYEKWVNWNHEWCSSYKYRNKNYKQTYWKKNWYRQRYYSGRSCWGALWWRRCRNNYGYRWRYNKKKTWRWKSYRQRYCAKKSSHPHYGGAWKVIGNTSHDHKKSIATDLDDEKTRVFEYKIFVNPESKGNSIFLKYLKLNFYGYK